MKEVKEADAATFQLVDGYAYFNGTTFWTRYAKDKNHVFFDDAVIPPDPETFEIVQFTEGGATTIFDKNHIYQGENSKELQKYLKDKYGK